MVVTLLIKGSFINEVTFLGGNRVKDFATKAIVIKSGTI